MMTWKNLPVTKAFLLPRMMILVSGGVDAGTKWIILLVSMIKNFKMPLVAVLLKNKITVKVDDSAVYMKENKMETLMRTKTKRKNRIQKTLKFLSGQKKMLVSLLLEIGAEWVLKRKVTMNIGLLKMKQIRREKNGSRALRKKKTKKKWKKNLLNQKRSRKSVLKIGKKKIIPCLGMRNHARNGIVRKCLILVVKRKDHEKLIPPVRRNEKDLDFFMPVQNQIAIIPTITPIKRNQSWGTMVDVSFLVVRKKKKLRLVNHQVALISQVVGDPREVLRKRKRQVKNWPR